MLKSYDGYRTTSSTTYSRARHCSVDRVGARMEDSRSNRRKPRRRDSHLCTCRFARRSCRVIGECDRRCVKHRPRARLRLAVFAAVIAVFERDANRASDTYSATTIIAAMLTFLLGAHAVLGDMRVAAAVAVATDWHPRRARGHSCLDTPRNERKIAGALLACWSLAHGQTQPIADGLVGPGKKSDELFDTLLKGNRCLAQVVKSRHHLLWQRLRSSIRRPLQTFNPSNEQYRQIANCT